MKTNQSTSLAANSPTRHLQDSSHHLQETIHRHSCLPVSPHPWLPTSTNITIIWTIILTVARTTLALTAKAFSVSAPSVWNSLTYNCRSAELLSTFRRNLKLSYLTLLTVNVNTRPSLCHLCTWFARDVYGAIEICFDWLIDWLIVYERIICKSRSTNEKFKAHFARL